MVTALMLFTACRATAMLLLWGRPKLTPLMHTSHCCAGFSLSRALQIGLPAHVAAIEEVSEYASKVSSEDTSNCNQSIASCS
jgi:hypothetical protein